MSAMRTKTVQNQRLVHHFHIPTISSFMSKEVQYLQLALHPVIQISSNRSEPSSENRNKMENFYILRINRSKFFTPKSMHFTPKFFIYKGESQIGETPFLHLLKSAIRSNRSYLTGTYSIGEMAMEITQCLLSAQSADARVRNEAEYNLSQFQEQNLPAFLLSLSVELANDEKPIESRRLAGIVLKNLLDAKDPATKKHLAQKWMAIDIAFKSQIKSWLLQTLGSSVPEARHTSAQVVAKVASIDVPRKHWPELIGHLLNNMTQQDSAVGLKQSTLKTLGYVCEEISVPDLQQDEVNFVLTAVIRGMELTENSSEVRLAATRTLFNALEFAQKNFENEKDQTYIMKTICQTALSKEVDVRQAAFECLASIASTYYSVLGTYMQALFELTSNAIKGDVERVSLQAIEFWSSICEKEIELQKYKTVEWNHWDSSLEFAPHSCLIENSRIPLVPLLLHTLLMQEENESQDDNIWNISMAGKKCLELVSQTVGVLILPLVVPFVVANRLKPDWHCREAAVSALGAIIKGSTVSHDAGDLLKYNELACQLIDDLVLLMNDESSQVKETTAWTVSLIFEFVHSPVGEIAGITSDNLPGVVDVLVKSLKDAPNVATKVCRAIYTLAEGYEDAEIHSSFFLPYIPRIIECLLFAASRADVDDSELRSAAYESVKEVVRCSSITQSSQIIRELLPVIMQRLSQTLELQIVSLDDKVNQADLQASLCGVLQVIIEKVSSAEDLETRSIILTQADQIMFLFLNVLACRSSSVHEETMLAIGALAHATGSEFSKYLPEFCKYLEMGLKNFKEYQACSVTVGVLSDIVHVLNYKVVPYCDWIMQILLINLSSEALDRSVKPPILSLIGYIALSVGENFQKYVPSAVPMMQRAAELCAQMDSNDDELLEYARQLKCSIFEAYSGILRGSKKSKIMMPYAQFLYEFIGFVLKEKDRHIVFRKALVAVMDDLADLLGTNTKTLFGDLAASVTYGGARFRSNGDNLK